MLHSQLPLTLIFLHICNVNMTTSGGTGKPELILKNGLW